MRRLFTGLFGLVFVAGLAVFAYGGWWLHEPLALKIPPGSQVLDLEIEPGTSAQGVAEDAVASGVDVPPLLLYAWFRLSGQARLLKAGSYEVTPGTTPRKLLSMLVRGEESLKSITFVEGWNIRQVLAALQKAEALKPDSVGLSHEAIMTQLGKPGVHPEGRFFPDTYTYSKGASDLAVLKRAARAMDKRLEAAWAQRAPDTPLKTPDEALVLASIVEKETGKPSDRAEIGGVFTNRLRMGMLLQTDPTVIYGLGEKFDGNLRRRDLQADTPYNTYTRAGLPPTPIAMPGKAALLAAVKPASTKAIYFVARGDGTSQFSVTLDEHNRAVNKFQRNK
ncbi:MAG TPA: endolytic transglycosylase MltG [Polaromonas sp.]|uniref:endolytic transglycosylase MltG n=1 Tax=Polaromonas sp. TaxID=1869339 RepID=UPI002D659F03|nr:endolytic transglycosylase MltG [Polaromonas sp.]HYW57299.1 endolytic transglycosylase MltG [Polaromonas sp.]